MFNSIIIILFKIRNYILISWQIRSRFPWLRVPICQGQALWHRGQLPDLRPVQEIGGEGLRKGQGTDSEHIQARKERGDCAEGQQGP